MCCVICNGKRSGRKRLRIRGNSALVPGDHDADGSFMSGCLPFKQPGTATPLHWPGLVLSCAEWLIRSQNEEANASENAPQRDGKSDCFWAVEWRTCPRFIMRIRRGFTSILAISDLLLGHASFARMIHRKGSVC